MIAFFIHTTDFECYVKNYEFQSTLQQVSFKFDEHLQHIPGP